jgi:hypothetical protein
MEEQDKRVERAMKEIVEESSTFTYDDSTPEVKSLLIFLVLSPLVLVPSTLKAYLFLVLFHLVVIPCFALFYFQQAVAVPGSVLCHLRLVGL